MTGWNAMLVRERLVEAADTMAHMITGRVGPGRLKSPWPVYAREHKDAYGYTEVKARHVPSAAHLSRAEEAQAWLSALIDEDSDRQMIWARAVCEAGKGSFAGWCRKNHVPRSSAYDKTDLIYERIALSLCKAEINLRYPDYGRVGQLPRIEGGQIDSLPVPASPRSWAAEPTTSDLIEGEHDVSWAARQNERRREQERRRRAKLGAEAAA